MRVRRRGGFTIIELVLVIAIVSALALAVFARFFDFSDDARDAAESGEVAAIVGGIKLYGAESQVKLRVPIYPTTLDSAAPGPSSSSNELFSGVLMQGMTDGRWAKVSATRYTSPAGKAYTYDPDAGTFLESSAPLTPLGSTFTEISGNFIGLIQDFYDANGYWPRSWGDYRYTDIGLDPDTWNGVPYEGIVYGAGGSRISIKPDAGWRFTALGLDGNTRVLTAGLNWNLWYDMNTSAWYYHSITPAEMIDISTLQITPP